MKGGKNEMSKLNIMQVAKTAPGYLSPPKIENKGADTNNYKDLHDKYLN